MPLCLWRSATRFRRIDVRHCNRFGVNNYSWQRKQLRLWPCSARLTLLAAIILHYTMINSINMYAGKTLGIWPLQCSVCSSLGCLKMSRELASHRPRISLKLIHCNTSTSLDVRRTRLSTVRDRAFPAAAARLWNSLPSHVTAALSPSSAVVLNHISSHFLIPLSDSSLICTVSA